MDKFLVKLTFLQKLLGYVGGQVKHLATNHLEVNKGKLTAEASF